MWIAVPIVGNRATFCRASKKDSNDLSYNFNFKKNFVPRSKFLML